MFFLNNTEEIDFSQFSSEHYSTDLEEKCKNHIWFLNNSSNKIYNGIIQIYSFNEIKNQATSQNYYMYILTNNKEKLIDELRHSEIASYFAREWESNSFHPIQPTEVDTSLLNKVLITCIMTVLLLTICDVLKNKKEVLIRKTFGMNNSYIVLKMYYKQMLYSILCYFVTFWACYFVFIGNFHEGAYEFIKFQMLYFALFVLLNIVVVVMIYFLTRSIKDVQHLKKPAYLKTVNHMNMILKVIVLLLVLEPMITFTKLGISEVENTYQMIANKEILRNQLYVEGIKPNVDFGYAVNILKNYFNEHGGIYQDFMEQDRLDYDSKDKIYDYPYLVVNQNYIRNYQVRSESGEQLDLNELKDKTLFIPKKYKDDVIDIRLYSDGMDSDVIYVENGMTYFNHDPLTAGEYGWSSTDPIVFIRDRMDKWSYPFMFLHYDDLEDRNRIIKDIEKILPDSVIFNTTDKMYDVTAESIKDHCINTVALLVVYIIVVFAFLYQSIYLYFVEYKEMFALKYIHGYSFVERHGEMLMKHIIVYVIPLLVGRFYFHLSLMDLVIFTTIVILFEVCAMYILTRIFEKNKISEILKGE